MLTFQTEEFSVVTICKDEAELLVKSFEVEDKKTPSKVSELGAFICLEASGLVKEVERKSDLNRSFVITDLGRQIGKKIKEGEYKGK